MKEETLRRIRQSTADLPERWREILEEALLDGQFKNEAERLLCSSHAIHDKHSPDMETAESILVGDAFIPMAVEVLLESGVSLEEIKETLTEAASILPG